MRTLWLLAASWALLACGGAGGEAEDADDARLDHLYLKLERLNALEAAAAGGGAVAADDGAEWSERQLELVAALAAEQPDLRADQLEELLADLRDVHADRPPPPATAPAPADTDSDRAPDYFDDDWHDAEEDYPMDDEEGAAEGEEEAWVEAEVQEDGERLRAAALQHWLRVQRAARCAEPAPRVLCAQDVHPHAGKVYLPQCAVLHRCGRDAGCCHDAALECAPLPRHVRLVRLPFYVLTVGSGGSTNSEERLPFLNHTRCGCMNRTAAAAARALSAPLTASWTVGTPRSPTTLRAHVETETEAPSADDSTRRPHLQRAAPSPAEPVTREPHPALSRRCNCPREFSASSTVGGDGELQVDEETAACACECRERQRDCARLAKGKEHFGLRDRLCINRGQCAPPRCEFGLYNRALGRCPRRRDPPDQPAPARHRFTSRLL